MVEGEKTNFGYDNDLLGTAAAVSKIIVPSKNAFSKYEQILELTRETIKTYDKKNLIVLLAIGLTATVLSYDLADNGFQVI
ncbi:GT-D fold domain-containing glycosyltransferase, partial [Aerococcus sp.]|uniref:GT-D fold domain-containing glycosyltransferase n=1 Tax=Aerococcus sp. TaxID=1872398 RepID=UPI0025C67B8C